MGDDDGTENTHSSKLRERWNKDSSSTSSLHPGSVLSASRNKRKRQNSHEARAQSGEEIDRTAQDTEVGASEEGKDVRISGRPGRRRTPPGKVRDECIALDVVMVPRKLRTAFRKRRREILPAQVQGGTSLVATIAPSSPISPTPSPSLKPLKRTKPNGTKFRPSKLVKVSTASAISQQEVEVAEALFDLARMLPGCASSFECKSEVKLKPGGNANPTFSVGPLQSLPPALVSSPASTPTPTPAQACTPSSPLPSPPCSSPAVLPAAAEAPKRKHSRVKAKIDEVILIQYEPKNVSAGDSGGSVLEPKVDVNQLINSAELNRTQMKAEVDIGGSNSSTLLCSGSLHSPVAVASSFSLFSANCMLATENNVIALGPEKPFNADLSGMNRLDKVLTYLSTTDTKSVLENHSVKPIWTEIANEYKQLDASRPVTNSQRGKSLSNTPASDTGQQSNCEIDFVEAAIDASMKVDVHDKDSVKDDKGDWKRKMGNNGIKRQGKSFVIDMEGKVGLDQARYEVKKNQVGNVKAREREKEKMQDFKPSSRQTGKNVKPDSILNQKTDRSESSFPIAAPSVSSGATSNISQSQPMSKGMTGWSRSLPHIGDYSPAAAAAVAAAVAAAWPSIGSASTDAALQVPPFIFPGVRQQHKRCATHIHIAHFIDAQRQMQRHPLWAATYGNIVAGSGPVLGYPVTQTMASLVSSSLSTTPPGSTVRGGNNLMSGSSGPETAGTTCLGSGSVISTCNGNVENAAAAQAQYMQAMIQQVGSCPFPSGHCAAPLNAHQESQPFGNPFHCASLVTPPQQSQQVPSVGCSTMSPLQEQQLNLQQGSHITHSASQRQQKQQLSASHSQSQKQFSSGQLRYSSGMEGNKGGEIGSLSESGLPPFRRDKYNQELPIAKAPTISSSCTSAMTAHDFSPIDGLGEKQAGGRLHNLQHQSSAQLQAQQQRRASTQIQHHLMPQNMSHESIDLQLFKEFSITSMGFVTRSPIGPGPLGLAPVAAVMAPQGHAILRTMADNVHSHDHAAWEQPHQQPWNMCMVKADTPVMGENNSGIGEGSFCSGSHKPDNIHDKRIPMKQVYLNTEDSPDAQGFVMANNVGGQIAHMPSCSGTNLKLMAGSIGNISSQQTGLVPVGCVHAHTTLPSQKLNSLMGWVKGMPSIAGASNDPNSYSTNASLTCSSGKSPVQSVHFQGARVGICSHNPRQGQVTSQHSSQAVPSGKRASGTTSVTTAQIALAPSMFAGDTITHEGQPATRRQQSALNVMPESRLSALAPSSSTALSFPPASKSNNVKGPFSLSQKQTGANASNPVSHTVAISHPSKISAKIGQSQKQQHQGDQCSLQQRSYLHKCHHEQQQFPQVLQQQAPVPGIQQTKTPQQHQPLMSSEVTHHEYDTLPRKLLQLELQRSQQLFSWQQHQQTQPSLQAQSHSLTAQKPMAHPNEHRSGIGLRHQKELQQQELSRPAQSYSLTDQKSMPHCAQHQSGQPMQEQSTITETLMQHPNLLTSGEHQSIHLPSFGVFESGLFPQTSPNSILLTAAAEMASSDGASNEAEGSGSAAKLLGSHGSATGSNSQRNDELSSSLLHSQIAGLGDAISSAQPLCTRGTNPSTFPDLNSASLLSSSGTMVDEKASTAAAFIEVPMPTSSGMVTDLTASSVCPQSIVAVMTNAGAQQTAAACIGGAGVTFQSGSVITGSTRQVIVSSQKSDSIPSTADTTQNVVSQLKSDAKLVLVAMSGTMHQGVLSKPQLPATAGESVRSTITATSMVACMSPGVSAASVCHNPA